MRFLETVQKVEKKISNFPVNAISQRHVAAFHEYVKSQNKSQLFYNAQIKGAMYFFRYLIDDLKVPIEYFFERVKLHGVHHQPEIIKTREFEKILSVITPETG